MTNGFIEILKFNLETEGYTVDTALFCRKVAEFRYYILWFIVVWCHDGEISDSPWHVNWKQDSDTKNIPIIFLTARDTENDTVTGFNLVPMTIYPSRSHLWSTQNKGGIETFGWTNSEEEHNLGSNHQDDSQSRQQDTFHWQSCMFLDQDRIEIMHTLLDEKGQYSHVRNW